MSSFAPAGDWDEDLAKQLVADAGLAVPARVVCSTHDEAFAALGRLRPPLVAKILDPAIEHKSDLGGIKLGIRDVSELEAALAGIDALGRDGHRYLIEETASPGPELILGARRDPAFGPIVALGIGGTGAEALGDAVVRVAPLEPAEAETMLGELAGAAAFQGARGAPAVDVPELASAIVAFGDLIAGRDDIAELEVNPLRVTSGGLVALERWWWRDDGRTIVVGAGPVGLTAALALRAEGIPVTVVETGTADRVRPGSRAIFIHGASIRLLDELRPGLGRELADHGLIWLTKRTLYRGREVYAKTYPPPPADVLPAATSLPQVVTEQLLLAAAHAAGVEFVWESPVAGVEARGDGVTVVTEGGSRLDADFAIGADGARSNVRSSLEIPLRARGRRTRS